MEIRRIEENDIAECLKIYNYYVRNTCFSLAEQEMPEEEWRRTVRKVTEKYPFVVAHDETGAVLGYAYLSAFNERSGYRYTADLSIYEANRDYLYRSLTELGYQCVRPDGAFYLFLKTPEGWCKRAMECDLLLVPGEEFSCPGYARLAYCVPLERLERAMPKFAALAEEFGLKK